MRESAAGREQAAEWVAPKSEVKLRLVKSVPEQKEAARETVTQRFEYLDAEGNSLGYAVMEVSAEEDTVDNGDEQLRTVDLVSLKIEGTKDGRPTSTDAMAIMNKRGIRVRLPAPGETNRLNYFSDEKNEVMAERPDNQVSLGILGHELGHAEQETEERYQVMNGAAEYAGSKEFNAPNFADWENLIRHARTVIRAVPEIGTANNVDEKLLNEMKKLHEDSKLILEEIEDIAELLKDAEQRGNVGLKKLLEGQERVTNDRYQAIQEKLTFMKAVYRIRDIVSAARLIHERDATRRSLGWMREIREASGSDVLATTVYDRNLKSERVYSVVSYLDEARDCLDSYGAHKYRVGHQDGGPRVTPKIGGDRLEDRPETSTQRFVRKSSVEPVPAEEVPPADVVQKTAPVVSPTPKSSLRQRWFGKK
jgi:hypothetical protein